MNYKYRRGQLFGKRLDVPKDVLGRVYRNICTYNDFVKYGLFDKIPTSCMRRPDIDILNKFGNDRCKSLDWELINRSFRNIVIADMIMSLDPETKDINLAIYEQIKEYTTFYDLRERTKNGIVSEQDFNYLISAMQINDPVIEEQLRKKFIEKGILVKEYPKDQETKRF